MDFSGGLSQRENELLTSDRVMVFVPLTGYATPFLRLRLRALSLFFSALILPVFFCLIPL